MNNLEGPGIETAPPTLLSGPEVEITETKRFLWPTPALLGSLSSFEFTMLNNLVVVMHTMQDIVKRQERLEILLEGSTRLRQRYYQTV